MATVIDSLVVKLGLDNSGFTKGKDSAKRDLNDLKGGANEANKSFDGLSMSAGKFLALLGGAVAIKKFVVDITESNTALSRFSQNMGLAVSNISAMSAAARIAGGSAGGLEAALATIGKAQGDLFFQGNTNLLPYLNYLRINLNEASGAARPATDVFKDLNRQFSQMSRPKAFQLGQMMGLDSGTMNLLLKSPQEYDRLIARQQKLGPLTKEQAAASERLSESWADMQTSGEAMGRSVMESVTPALQAIMDGLTAVGEWVSENKEFVVGFFQAVAVVLTTLYLPAMARVAVATLAATWPFLAIAGAIAAISAAIGLAIDDFQAFKRGAESVFDWSPVQKIMGWLGGDNESTSSGGAKNGPRGIRNNNPGNLNFAGQKGAKKEGGANGRFAVFGSMSEGLEAMVGQLGLYMGRGNNTIRGIINKWAPSSENNTGAYIDAVSKKMGISADTPLSMNDQSAVKSLVMAIVEHENGKGFVSDAQVSAAVSTVAGARSGRNGGGSSTPSNTTVTTSIGEVKVFTQATDARGIAGALGNELQDTLTYQTDAGMN